MEKYISIGKMAKINHISVNTLRLYDKWGLLTPEYVDQENNYRYYSMRQNARLDLITYMKELGMSLKEIKEILDQEDLNLIEAILIKKDRSLTAQMDQIRRQQAAVKRTIYSVERYRKSPSPGTLTTEFIDRRRYYQKTVSKNFYNYGIDTYEEILKEFKDQLMAAHLPQVYYCNVGTFLSRENFIHQHFETYDSFVFVDDNFPDKDHIKVLESGMYACIYLDDFEKEEEYAKKLYDYCVKNRYRIIGDYICEVLNELLFFKDKKRTMYLRLQVPILFPKAA